MNVKAKTNTEQLELFQREIDEKIKAALVAVSSDAIADMRKRVEAGKNLKDRKMPDYSPSYKKWKKSRGRDVSKRDLTFTGTMLGAIQITDIEKRGDNWVSVIGIGDDISKQIALYNQQIDPWFGFSPSNKKQISESIKTQMKKVIGG